VLLHINLAGSFNLLQQEAMGSGRHLIYAAFHELQTKESFLEGLAQDVVKSESRSTTWIFAASVRELGSPHLLAHLVVRGLAEAVFFPSKAPAFRRRDTLQEKPSAKREL